MTADLLEWLSSVLDKNKVGKLELVEPIRWNGAISGHCHRNVKAFCEINTDR